MQTKQNFDLTNLNSFKVPAKAKYYASVTSVEEARQVLQELKAEKLLILGGGSNTLFTTDWDGLVLSMDIQGIEKLKEDEEHVWLRIGAGEDWPKLVENCVENEWAGIENLALIPGNVGAAPVQNIAAYGQNLVDIFDHLEALNVETLEIEKFDTDRCEFAYRSSVFKRELKGKYIITHVVLRLNKDFALEANYHERKGRYGSLEGELAEFATEPYTIHNIYTAVVRQRTKRLPSLEAGDRTCGSFFKNPMITRAKYQELAAKVEELQSYPAENLNYSIKNWADLQDDYVKIPAGRLIDELGWRGKRIGNVGVSPKHALCVVSYEGSTGAEVREFVEQIRADVFHTFGVELESEVNIID